MHNLHLKITMADGRVIIAPATPRVIVNFERHFKTSMVKAMTEDQKLEHQLFIGWEACKAAGEVVKLFDTWLDEVQAVEFVWDNDTPKDSPVA